MNKRIVSVLLSLTMILSVITLPRLLVFADEKVPNKGDYLFEFDNENDIIKLTNGSVSGGKLLTVSGRNKWNNLTAILNYQLDSNKTYSYEVTGNLSNYSGSYDVQAFFTTSTDSSADTKDGKLVNLYYPSIINGWATAKNGAISFEGEFKTSNLVDGKNYLAFYINDGTTADFEFDSIKIMDLSVDVANSGDFTFEFDNEKRDIKSLTNGSVKNGKLSTIEGKKAWNNLTAILNYKLDSRKTYGYELKGTVSDYESANVQAILTTASATVADTQNGKLRNLYFKDAISGWATPKNGEFTFNGEFTTGDLTEDSNFLALWLNDGTTAKFEFEYIKIFDNTPVAQNTGNYLFEFDNLKKDISHIENGDVSNGKLKTKQGKIAWNNLTAILNYKLESNQAYSYEIVGSISNYSSGNVQAVLTTATSNSADTQNGKLRNLYFKDAISGWATPKNGEFTFKGEFTTGELKENQDYIALWLNDGTTADFEIESVKIIDGTVYSGNYTFNFEKGNEILKLNNASVSGGLLKFNDPLIGSGDHLLSILNYKLKSNKTYNYEMKLEVKSVGNGKYTQGGFYFANDNAIGSRIEFFMPGRDSIGNAIPEIGEYTLKGKFNTEKLSEKDFLAVNFWDVSGAELVVDYIVITETDYVKVEPYTGNHTFNFDDFSDSVKLNNAEIQDSFLTLNDPKIGSGDHLTAILNYKLKSNKTYTYELKLNVSDAGNGKYTQGGFYTASSTAVSEKLGFFMPGRDDIGNAMPKSSEYILTGKFVTAEIGDKDFLSINFWDASGGKFEIDYLTLTETDYVKVEPYTGNHSFEFNADTDIIKLTNADIKNGKLTLNDPEIGSGDRLLAIFNYKLKSNKTYTYEFKLKITDAGNGKHSQAGIYTASTAAPATKLSFFMPNSDLNGYAAPKVGEYIAEGEFNTDDIDEKEFLAINFWDVSGAVYEIESFSIVESEKVVPVIYSGDHTFDFNNKIETATLKNAKIKDGKLILNDPEIGNGDRLLAILNYKLKSNKTYTYEIKLKITVAGNTKYSQAGLYNANNSAPDKLLTYFMPNCDTKGYAKPSVGEYTQKGMFNTDSLNDKDYLAINFWDVSGAIYEIDSIAIFEHEKVVIKTYKGTHRFDFDKLSDIDGYTGNVEIKDGKLNLYGKTGKTTSRDNFVKLPFKLESNKTYAYEVKYTATEPTTEKANNELFSFIYSNGTRLDGKTIKYINSHYGWDVLLPTTTTHSGIFRTEAVEKDKDYLVIKFGDRSGQNLFIDYVDIKEVEIPIHSASNYTLDFNSITDIDEVLGNATIPAKDPKTGKNALALEASSLGQGTFLRLPITLEPLKYYQVSIDYRFSGDAEDLGSVLFDMWPGYNKNIAKDGSFLHKNSSISLKSVLNTDEVKSTDSYQNITISFSTTEAQLEGGKNYLCLTYDTKNLSNAILYIDKFSIKEVDKYDVAVMASIDDLTWSKPKVNPDDYSDWKNWDITDMKENKPTTVAGETAKNNLIIPIIIFISVVCIGGISGFVVFKKRKKNKT